MDGKGCKQLRHKRADWGKNSDGAGVSSPPNTLSQRVPGGRGRVDPGSFVHEVRSLRPKTKKWFPNFDPWYLRRKWGYASVLYVNRKEIVWIFEIFFEFCDFDHFSQSYAPKRAGRRFWAKTGTFAKRRVPKNDPKSTITGLITKSKSCFLWRRKKLFFIVGTFSTYLRS